MIFISLALWIIASILFFTNPRNESTRWVSAIAFCSGSGSFGVYLNENITPAITSINTTTYYILRYSASILLSLAHFVAPYTFLVFSLVYYDKLNKAKKRNLKLLLLIPVTIMYFLFPISTSFYPTRWILTVWVTPYVMTANILLIYSFLTTKPSKVKQQKLLTIIILTPTTLFSLMTNYIFFDLGISEAWRYNLWIILFQFAAFIFFGVKYGIFGVKMRFQKYHYAALENIIDNISDSFIVIDNEAIVTDFNKPFLNDFGDIQKGQNFFTFINNNALLSQCEDSILAGIEETRKSRKAESFEQNVIQIDSLEKHFTIEITPVIFDDEYIATVILFKDITEHKRVLTLIEHNERLMSISQLIGGIAHSLKTPLFACSGGIDILSNLTKQSSEFVDTFDINPESIDCYQKEIIYEMEKWETRIKEYLYYMNDVISAVKEQAIIPDESQIERFTLKELISKINILMKIELKANSCIANFNLDIDENTSIEGDINSLIQVLNNLISNAIDSYETQKGGIIDITFKEKHPGNVDISVKDYGEGISSDVQKKIFKQMVTTKGKDGTGLGLYISKSIIASRFKGKLNFESQEGEGSTFIISLPVSVLNPSILVHH